MRGERSTTEPLTDLQIGLARQGMTFRNSQWLATIDERDAKAVELFALWQAENEDQTAVRVRLQQTERERDVARDWQTKLNAKLTEGHVEWLATKAERDALRKVLLVADHLVQLVCASGDDVIDGKVAEYRKLRAEAVQS